MQATVSTDQRVTEKAGRKLAVCEITTRDWDLEQEVQAYIGAGIDALGVYRPKLDRLGVGRAAALLRQMGLPAVSMISGKTLTGNARSLSSALVDTHRRLLDDCSALGATTLVVVPGCLHGRSPERVGELAIEALMRLADEAASHGICLALEPIRTPYFDYFNTLVDATKMARTVQHPNVGIVFDTWHLWDEPGLRESVENAIDLIRLVHLSDWRIPTRGHDDRMVPGDGAIPLAGIVRQLESLGYSGTYEIEIYSEDEWASDYHELLNRCRVGFDRLWSY